MTDAPERIWATTEAILPSGAWYERGGWITRQTQSYPVEYIRADLATPNPPEDVAPLVEGLNKIADFEEKWAIWADDDWSHCETIRKAADTLTALAAKVERLEAERENAVLAERERMKDWCSKRLKIRLSAWERDARTALAGDPSYLRNRIAMIDDGPMGVVLSDDDLQETSDD